MKNKIKAEISKVLEREFVLEKPKDKNLAHYATPLFSLAKELRKSPAMIASEFADKFSDSKIVEASAVNGYLNFKLKSEFLDEISKQILLDSENFAKEDVKKNTLAQIQLDRFTSDTLEAQFMAILWQDLAKDLATLSQQNTT